MSNTARGRAGSALLSIDRQCDEFERNWLNGQQPRIEEVLAQLPADTQAVAFRELLAIELDVRRQKGEEVNADEYRQRFPERTAVVDEVVAMLARDLAETSPLSSPSDTTPSSATTSTRYEQLRFFRRGGLGALYRAVDESLHRETVVKFMNEQCEKDPSLVAQFKVEAEVTGRLDHPGIVPVYGIGQDWQGRPFYVMRMINGRELKQAIVDYHHGGQLKPVMPHALSGGHRRQMLCNLLEHLANACNTVAYAHHVGVVHCDIKPANIMIGKYGETFVLDWGLATNFERSSTFFSPNEPTMRPHSATGSSTSGQRGGTYGYSSPEQVLTDGPLGPTSDVYSLGATLYEIITGQSPFNGRDPNVRELIRSGEFPPPHKLQRDVCPRLEAICLKAMALAPQSRYPTAKLLADDLNNWMRDEEITAVPDRWFDRLSRVGRRHRGLTAAAFILLTTFLVAAGWIDRMWQAQNFQKKTFLAEKQGLETALNVFEDICQPFANGEMNNLGDLRRIAQKIKNFTSYCLANFPDTEGMQFHTARVYELRSIISHVVDNNLDSALADLRQAEELYRKSPASMTEKFDRDKRLAHNHLNQGRLLIDLQKWSEARGICESTAENLQRLRASQPDDKDVQRLLAEAYHCLGETFLNQPAEGAARQQALIDAESRFTESKKIREQLVATTSGEDSRNHIRDLARSLGYLGDVYCYQGEIPKAAQAYEESKKYRETLYRTMSSDPEHRFQYSRALANFGRLERGYRGDLKSAIENLEKAADFQQGLHDSFPEVAVFESDLGDTRNTLAEVYLMASVNEPQRADELRQKAHAAAEAASQIYGRLERQNSGSGASGLAQSLLLLDLDGTASADEARRHAQDAEKRLNSMNPEETLGGSDLVTLAMARSIQGQLDAALRALKLAVQRGENTAYRFEQHRKLAFKALADDDKFGPQFDALVKKVRAGLTLQ
ncbi:MAG TPA: serine/threonine-protein kinase [Pirellulaceae bacterium]